MGKQGKCKAAQRAGGSRATWSMFSSVHSIQTRPPHGGLPGAGRRRVPLDCVLCSLRFIFSGKLFIALFQDALMLSGPVETTQAFRLQCS